MSGQSFQPAYQPASLPSTRRRRIATLSLWRGRNLEWRFCWTLRPDTGALVPPKFLVLVMALHYVSKNNYFTTSVLFRMTQLD